jgi:two-component system phosphate regulon response regulator OmpR
MLTAKGDEVDRIVGLEMGADDYLPKPFNPRELLARITAILRRQANTEVLSKNKVVIFGEYSLNIEQRSLYKKDDEISITTGEFDLLKIFAERPMQPLSRDQIMQLSRGKELDVFDRSIDVKITRLRRLIEEDPNKPVFIQTKWGFGYIFNPDGATK